MVLMAKAAKSTGSAGSRAQMRLSLMLEGMLEVAHIATLVEVSMMQAAKTTCILLFQVHQVTDPCLRVLMLLIAAYDEFDVRLTC
mmetsp:Transcript_3831/g.6750  ORF Transcript_3831/g.6750 Transcript_3831/m.6750 type:complete len:85 (-) Transcript_3831:543-797(-)